MGEDISVKPALIRVLAGLAIYLLSVIILKTVRRVQLKIGTVYYQHRGWLRAIEEFPTIYLNNLDTLIATARSTKVVTTIGIQDFSQPKKDYGKDTQK